MSVSMINKCVRLLFLLPCSQGEFDVEDTAPQAASQQPTDTRIRQSNSFAYQKQVGHFSATPCSLPPPIFHLSLPIPSVPPLLFAPPIFPDPLFPSSAHFSINCISTTIHQLPGIDNPKYDMLEMFTSIPPG